MSDVVKGYTGEVENNDQILVYEEGRLVAVRPSEKAKLKQEVHEAAQRGFNSGMPKRVGDAH